MRRSDFNKNIDYRWEINMDYGWPEYKCPDCKWAIREDIHVQFDYKYCPGCGRRMISERYYMRMMEGYKES